MTVRTIAQIEKAREIEKVWFDPRPYGEEDILVAQLKANRYSQEFREFKIGKDLIVEEIMSVEEIKEFRASTPFFMTVVPTVDYEAAFDKITNEELMKLAVKLFSDLADGNLEYETRLVDEHENEI